MKNELPSFAVLIDADNVRLDTISPILEEITRNARITVRRIYGDFTSQNLAAWKTKLAEHAIHPIQQYRNTIGKNASDSALIIDAMDLLHSRRFEGFCLVSSDSDFTRLATRIREDGLVVYGFGEKKAPKAFVNACDRYIYVENLVAPVQSEQPIEASHQATVESAAPTPEGQAPLPPTASVSTNEIVVKPIPIADAIRPINKSPKQAANLLQRAFTNVADEHGWALLGSMSSYIHANHSDFDPRSFGCTKFIDLILKTEIFELVNRTHKNGVAYFCRPKQAAVKPKDNRDFSAALVNAVQEAKAQNGWSPVGIIGQKLKAKGFDVSKSGYATLTDALKATSLFDMQGSGAARYFRPK